jgi:hypothetical protein
MIRRGWKRSATDLSDVTEGATLRITKDAGAEVGDQVVDRPGFT